ncbi:MAG: SDR family oxidoreductase [Verrucomicrobia subdivision 3 bacterium]|nr:SDR family oxidoreductase [Limisphaerales bacterium]
MNGQTVARACYIQFGNRVLVAVYSVEPDPAHVSRADHVEIAADPVAPRPFDHNLVDDVVIPLNALRASLADTAIPDYRGPAADADLGNLDERAVRDERPTGSPVVGSVQVDARYTKGAARDLAPRKITVNVVQPGAVDTDMNPATGDLAAVLNAATALGRYGRPEEIAAAIAFLASPGASYITGTTLDVDGGFNA